MDSENNSYIKHPNNYHPMLNNVINTIISNNVVHKIYIYGSYVSGTINQNSDIDIIIVSDNFYGLSQYICRNIILNQLELIDIKIDPVCMTKNDFIKYKSSKTFRCENPILLYEED